MIYIYLFLFDGDQVSLDLHWSNHDRQRWIRRIQSVPSSEGLVWRYFTVPTASAQAALWILLPLPSPPVCIHVQHLTVGSERHLNAFGHFQPCFGEDGGQRERHRLREHWMLANAVQVRETKQHLSVVLRSVIVGQGHQLDVCGQRCCQHRGVGDLDSGCCRGWGKRQSWREVQRL